MDSRLAISRDGIRCRYVVQLYTLTFIRVPKHTHPHLCIYSYVHALIVINISVYMDMHNSLVDERGKRDGSSETLLRDSKARQKVRVAIEKSCRKVRTIGN